MRRIIFRAGLNPWPKIWQNLRSTRETELAEDFPMHVVCDWIGNTQPVAMKHYLQVTDAHFAKATNSKAVQKAVQNPSESTRIAEYQQGIELSNNSKCPTDCGTLRIDAKAKEKMAEVHGNRTSAKTPRKQQHSQTSGAKSGAVDVMSFSDEEYLRERWPYLSQEAVKMILAVVNG